MYIGGIRITINCSSEEKFRVLELPATVVRKKNSRSLSSEMSQSNTIPIEPTMSSRFTLSESIESENEALINGDDSMGNVICAPSRSYINFKFIRVCPSHEYSEFKNHIVILVLIPEIYDPIANCIFC